MNARGFRGGILPAEGIGRPDRLLAGLGATLVALLVLGSSSAAPPGVVRIVSPPFSGHVYETNATYLSGCGGNVTITHAWHFHLKTGIGGGAVRGNASNCAKPPFTTLSYANATAAGGLAASIKFSGVPKGTSKITLDLGG